MARTLIIAFEKVLLLFSRKSSKRHGDLNFWYVKNAWKSSENYEFWPAPRTIHTPRSGIQMGAQNHAKLRQNASKITAKSTRKNMHAAVAMVKNARRRLTCKNASNCVNFCHSRCCFAHAMDAKIVQNRRKFITKWPQKNARPGVAVPLLIPYIQNMLKIRNLSTIATFLWSCPPRGGPIRSVSL